MSIPDGGTELRDIQAANFLLACYAISLIHGETIKNIRIRYATLKGYLARAVECWTDRNKASPRLAETDYIHLLLEAVRKYEKVPNRREMITDSMFANMIDLYKQYQLTAPDSLVVALFEWVSLGRYTGFRSIEWCHDNEHTYSKISDPLWDGPEAEALIMADIIFLTAAGKRVHITTRKPLPPTEPIPRGIKYVEITIGSKRTIRTTKSSNMRLAKGTSSSVQSVTP